MTAFVSYASTPHSNHANPSATFSSDQQSVMLQMGLQYGQSVLKSGEYGIMRHIPVISGIRRYFRVDNQYVKSKLATLVAPFTRCAQKTERGLSGEHVASGSVTPFGGDVLPHSPVAGTSPTSTSCGSYPPPFLVNSISTFDLYIPLMGAVTYVILCGFIHGLRYNSVTNEHLLASASSLVFWLLVEVFALKLASYFLRLMPDVTFLDLAALCGYKYITICLVLLLRELVQLESDAWYIGVMVMYILLANGFFVAKAVMMMYQRGGRTPSNAVLLAYGAACLQAPLVIWLAVKPFW